MSESDTPAGAPPAPATRLARQLVDAAGGQVRAILLYGSQLLRTRPDDHSAFDFVVIVQEYRAFYAALRAAHELPRPVGLMTAMAGVLPPNVIAFAPGEGHEGIAKCLVITRGDFAIALSAEPRDHFLLGRMVQRVSVLWSASAEDAAWVESELAGARGRVMGWMAPYLEGPFDAQHLGRRLLEVCYQGELRPEAKDRAATIFAAQAEHFRSAFPAVLENGVAGGVLERAGTVGEGATYTLAQPASDALRRRWRRHFRRSKVRATARWLKHIVTFANWLPYVVRKVERHTGRTIELTRLERKLPLVFLWPRAVRVLLSRPQREVPKQESSPGREVES